MSKPLPQEYHEFYHPFIKPVPYDDIVQGLEQNFQQSIQVLQRITDIQSLYRYAPDKWSIKELLAHIIDCERVYGYRALTIAREKQPSLVGFDQDSYVKTSGAEHRKMSDLLDEFTQVRQATIALFKSFTPQQLRKTGKANGFDVSVNFMGFLAIGHELHHVNVIKEKYLSAI